MPNKRSNVWLWPYLLFAAYFVEAQNGPQPCPENPIVLTASDFGQFVYSPYDEHHKYPPNTDCRFILVARTLQRRIHINMIESQLEEPLFTDCKDYISIRDGALPTSQEIIRWCGSSFPPALTSSGDSLYIHFHSDNIIQSRGFNLSFVDFEIPGCPSDWISDSDSKFCYRLFSAPTEFTFVDAQKTCFYERANLLTIENSDEYDFIVNQYGGSHTYPWIGYNDANKEGIFDPIDPNVKTWPENFPNSKTEHSDKDCVFLDWNVKDGFAHTIEDCRNRHSLICKKRQDGTTIPIQLSNTLIRYGFQAATFNYTILLIILLGFLILFIIFWIVYQKCKRQNTVEAVNRNQRTPIVAETERRESKSIKTTKTTESTRSKSEVSAAIKTKSSSTDALKHIVDTNSQRPSSMVENALHRAISEEEENTTLKRIENSTENNAYGDATSPRIHTKPNQPIPIESNLQSPNESRIQIDQTHKIEENQVQQSSELHEEEEIKKDEPVDRSHLYIENNEESIKVVSKSTQKVNNGNVTAPLHSVLPPVGEPIHREATNVTGLSSTRSRVTHPSSQQTFERPHVGTLDNISAISLDEFWQKN